MAKPALFDTHCHLDAPAFDPMRESCIANASQVGVKYLLVPSVGGKINFTRIASLQKRYGVLVAFGLHPLYANRYTNDDLSLLEEWLQTKQPIAVGEIGLDNWQGGPDMSHQQTLLELQLKLAQHYHMPVILHARRAVDLVLQKLRQTPLVGGIVHAFNGSEQQANQFIQLGFKLGFGGTLTYPQAHHIRRLVATLPNEALVLETDAPDMPPVWSPNHQSQPADIAQYATIMATLRQQKVEDVISLCMQNTLAALQLKESDMTILHL